MIVVDTNILIYLYLPSPQAEQCHELLERDANWACPAIWRSEFGNTLLLYLRKKIVASDFALQAINAAESLIGGNEIESNAAEVISLAMSSGCTFYDCEFAAAAKSLSTVLVTEDKALLKAFPKDAFSLKNALASL